MTGDKGRYKFTSYTSAGEPGVSKANNIGVDIHTT